MKSNYISIITSTYNAGSTLQNCINSIKAQSSNNFEFLIIDGGSKDDTINIIKANQDYIRYWVSEPDEGIYDAWNKGISQSLGNYVMFLGADDYLKPDAIKNYSSLLDTLQIKPDYISGKVEVVNQKGEFIKCMDKPWIWTRFKKFMDIAHVASIHSMEYFKKYGLFNTEYKIAGDYELLLRSRGTLQYFFLDQVVATMTFGGQSFTNLKVFKESLIAKNTSGGVNFIKCYYDYYVAKIKFQVKSLVNYGK